MLLQYPLIATILIANIALTASTLSDDCAVKHSTVTCQKTIPTELPDNTTEVYIKNWFQEITDNTFNHSSWSSVEKLDITVLSKGHDTEFGPYNLQSLSNLQYLGYHSPNLGNVSYPATFTGIKKLRILDLADCIQDIVGSLMRTLTTTGILPVLDTIILDRTNTIFAGKPFDLNKTFSDVLHFKKIKHLSLSGTYFLIKDMQILNNTFALESFNISYAFAIFINSNSKLKKMVLNNLLKDLKTLDMTNYKIGSQADHYLTSETNFTPAACNSESEQSDYLFGLENLYANDLQIASAVKSYVDISKCLVNWKVVHAARNNLEELDITIKWPTSISLYELDISYNKMKYLSPAALSGVHSMKNMFLSYNRLSLMADTSEFSELFKTFQLLEHVTLANNGLSYIPENMFEKNIHMKVIDLSGNELTSITFETKQFKALMYLDLSSNKIYIIDVNTRSRLDRLMNTGDGYIDLSGNAFQCSCESQDSIKWLIAFQEMNNVSFTCESEGKEIGMDTKALGESQYQCYKVLLLLATIAIGVVAVLVASLLTFLIVSIIRKYQRKDAVKRFIKNYRHKNIVESFLVMLSYSSLDGDLVLESIYPMLEYHLRDRVKIANDIVCIDDKHFRPGRTIVEEMMDHIRDSCVVVFVVSNSFCKSQWCCQEVEEAYARGKPIILLYLEEVDQDIMPAHLRDLFDRYTRTKLKVDDQGQYHLKPSWPLLSQSILELASQKLPP